MNSINHKKLISSRLSQQEKQEEKCSVFVGSVPFEMDEFRLCEIFKSVGPVRKVTILRDRRTGRNKQCAYIRFNSELFAKNALKIKGFYVC
ncbi:hypothetical protein niasHS_005608 [Heterodera schachtii]|uniref:RRM domain-containing protein n=1 Tax=Heterodera schachtii TaxID=97005 RepID=A0ABD2JYY5_HETSC